MSAPLVLFGTRACTLCEQARALVLPVAEAFGWALVEQDVADDDRLFERYGTRVPVLRRDDLDAELAWPFDAAGVAELLGRPRSG
ncbi:MAG: glutaredoxin family protein [Pseudomonadales bacterium]|jgi:hypothetical protein|nr:glutaredoxin family protein [Pseudomonadales bacterium]